MIKKIHAQRVSHEKRVYNLGPGLYQLNGRFISTKTDIKELIASSVQHKIVVSKSYTMTGLEDI